MIVASAGASLVIDIHLYTADIMTRAAIAPLVVKIGGGAGVDIAACVGGIARAAADRPVIVVHGVSASLDRLCAERGVTTRTITSPSGHVSRYTDAPTRDLYVEAAHGVSADLVERLCEHGVDAVAMGAVITATRKDAVRALVNGRVRLIHDDYSGAITGVDAERLLSSLADGQTFVVPPLALSPDGLLNIDGDRAAAAIAAAVGADDLVILSNVRGLYRDHADPDSLVKAVRGADIERALTWAAGRMKRKVIGAREALNGGVVRVTIADGRISDGLAQALDGAGTVFTS